MRIIYSTPKTSVELDVTQALTQILDQGESERRQDRAEALLIGLIVKLCETGVLRPTDMDDILPPRYAAEK